jgi:hypothetical protein
MMAEHDLAVSHTTILRWVIRYVPEFEKRWNRWSRAVHSSWGVDETYICTRVRAGFSEANLVTQATLGPCPRGGLNLADA